MAGRAYRDAAETDEVASHRKTPSGHRGASLAAFVLVLLCLITGSALADDSPAQDSGLPTPGQVIEAIESDERRSPRANVTNPSAAENVPHEDLGREEALDLLRGVFKAQLHAPAGIFDELEVEKFLSSNVAVIAGTEPPTDVTDAPQEAQIAEAEEESDPSASMALKEELRGPSSSPGTEPEVSSSGPDTRLGRISGATLLHSSIPLHTETSSGEPVAVDLGLEHAEGELQPKNPLVEVGIPQQLGEGIELPDVGVTIKIAGAPEDRSPSLVEDGVAFLPNVAPDTDLVIAPTPTGVETFTHLRSADSPRSQTFNLDLPADAVLEAKDNGGAAVIRADKQLVEISPPVALDATGADVPVVLDVSHQSFTLTVFPDDSAQFPILVDPLIHTYNWTSMSTSQSGICSSSFKPPTGSTSCNFREEWGYEQYEQNRYQSHMDIGQYAAADGTTGISISTSETLTAGDRGVVLYTVPRYFTEEPKPTSFISKMTLSNLRWEAYSSSMSPYLFAGIWDPVKPGWVSYYSHEGLIGHGLNDTSWQYQFPNPNGNTNAKVGMVSIQATETKPNSNGHVVVRYASIQLDDKGAPGFGSISGPSSGWVDQVASPINFTVSDSGLGVHSLTANTGPEGNGNLHSWKTPYGCIGVSGAACPRTWSSIQIGRPPLKYEPSAMPTGINYLGVVAEDPVGNKSAPAYAQVKVDHKAPQLSLAGTMTEQATLGTKRQSYTLRVDATDGTAEQPQSGVAKTAIKVDGNVVDEVSPGCATKSCGISREWTIESSEFSAGPHTVTVIATDAVGLTATKTFAIELDPAPPPTVALSGTMTEQATLGASRPRYELKVNASAQAGLEASPLDQPAFASSFGSAGAGSGQFNHPAGVAVDHKGNVWVVDQGNDRVLKFSETGQYLSSFGSPGAGNGQFGRPTSIAIDSAGNLLVTDAGNSRVEKFSAEGVYLAQFGSHGTANGQFSSAEGIAIDPKGNIWVGDTYNGRLQKFNANGEFIKVVSSKGFAPGQLGEPTDLDIGPGGNVWVADWQNNRVAVFNEAGQFLGQLGTYGAGEGQFNRPDVIDVDSAGNVWVGDQNNGRVQAFSQSGEYLTQFGTKGGDQGQFNFGWPMGIATDSKGRIWVADTANNRVQRWQIPNYVPAYLGAFGSLGTANSEFNHPADATFDTEGNLWVVDAGNNRVQKFDNLKGYLAEFGSPGSGNGQLNAPSGIAGDVEGNLWVVDTGNNRVQKFNGKGEYLAQFGSYGSGDGQFKEPAGIAVHQESGVIFVTDRGNHRVQAFSKSGEYLGQRGSYGSEDIQFDEPTGIAIGGPSGESAYTFLVVDAGNNRVKRYTGSGTLLGKFGSAGSGPGQFDRPGAVDVDAKGNVWVSDQNNSRVQKFNQSGELITQFGSQGVGDGQFSLGWPMGIATDSKGTIAVTDPQNNRIQLWNQANWRSEIETEISVDGQLTASEKSECPADRCTIARDWTLDSSAYTPGQHAILVKATDGIGNTTSKSLTVDIQRDTVKPTLQAGGELVEAPEGWVEQESYTLNASATDAGYGVTSLAFKIDGEQVASVSNACADGGCEQSLTKSLDMSAYEGGAHPAELVATDGAGNAATKSWTINVNPDGNISTSEAEETIDAADATSGSSVVTPTNQLLEPGQIEGGDNPGLQFDGSEISSTGVPNTTTMTTNPADGFTIKGPEGATTITPMSEGSSEAKIAAGVTRIASDTAVNVDSAIRPQYNGAQTFQAIRSAESVHSFSWSVSLAQGQALESIDSKHAQVVYEDGTTAFLITAELAHDATGADVGTSLTVDGNVLTLTVEADPAHVYPVIAGQGWETSYEMPIIVEGPEDEEEIKKREAEERAAENAELESATPPPVPSTPLSQVEAERLVRERVVSSNVAPPPYPPSGGASASRVRTFTVKEQYVCQRDHCAIWKVYIRNPSFIRGPYWAEWESGTQVHCGSDQHWAYSLVVEVDQEGCGFAGPWKVWKGEGKHLTIWSRFHIWTVVLTPTVQFTVDTNLALKVWVWPNGFQQKVVGRYTPWIKES